MAEPAPSIAPSMAEPPKGVCSYAQRSLDRVIPPSSRRRAYDSAAALAAGRPVLFVGHPPVSRPGPADMAQSFAVAQLAFCFLPLLLFAAFAGATVATALGAAILFALFWIGVALLVLVPTLLVASSIALLVWAWALGSFVVARWLYAHAPGGTDGVVARAKGDVKAI